MSRLRVLTVIAWLACVSSVGAQQFAQPMRDPDRGLDAEFRARLALIDVERDTWTVERWSAAMQARLDELAARWAENQLDAEPNWTGWIAPELRVARLYDPAANAAPAASTAPGANTAATWRLARGTGKSEDAPEPLARALGAWRKSFTGESRLDFEIFGVRGTTPTLEATVRVQASGANGATRAQHNATWTCTWRVEAAAVQLVGLRVDAFEAIALASNGPPFVDVTEALFEDPALYRERFAPGIEHWRRRLASKLDPGMLAQHGVAVGDVDGDGLEDLYVCRPGGLPNQLLKHTPDHRLRDVSAAAGVDLLDFSSSALLVDLDADVDLDLVVATGVGLVFFANDGSGRFESKFRRERSLATSLSAADFDGDGDADLYVCSYLSPYEKNGLPLPYHDANNGEANELLRNDGSWSFTDVTAEVGLDEHNRRFSFAAAWEDFDNDGDQDLYVANDFGRKNLYRNDGGRFHDVAPELAADDVSAGMGVDWGDVDHDGWMDLYVTNMCTRAGARLTAQPGFRGAPGSSDAATESDYRDHALGNTLLANRAGRAFEDVAEASGTSFGRWGWGAIFVDFDNDGALDLFAPNGFASGEREPDLDSFFWRQVVLQSPSTADGPHASYALGWRAINRLVRQGYSWNGHERNVALWNVGASRFVDVSAAVGLDQPDDSRAAARLDWDGDGDEELVVTNRTAPMLRVFDNRQATGHAWIAFELASRDPRRTAIGARVSVDAGDGRTHSSTLRCGHGYLAQSSARLHFGLGRANVRNVRVRWPSGEVEDFGAPAPGATYALVQGSGAARALAARGAATPASRAETRVDTAPSAGAARTVLPTPLPLPRLALETWDQKPASLLGITMQGPQGTGRPLVVLLWSVADAASLRALQRFTAGADRLRAAQLDQVLALSVDVGDAERARALDAWKASAWPFARGFVGEESSSVLELVLAALHDDAHGLTLPAAFLIEPGGRLVATYEGEFEPATLQQDLALFALSPEARRDACVPFPGRWIAPLPEPLDQDVAARLNAHGLARPASEYGLAHVEVRPSSNADIEVQIGIARHQQGRLPDAIAHYRRALAVDPAHVLAAQSLAVALHESGDLQSALVAYKEALKLAPAHADTRLNLGYLCLTLKDVAGAESELAALRQLGSTNAATLAARIRASKGE